MDTAIPVLHTTHMLQLLYHIIGKSCLSRKVRLLKVEMYRKQQSGPLLCSPHCKKTTSQGFSPSPGLGGNYWPNFHGTSLVWNGPKKNPLNFGVDANHGVWQSESQRGESFGLDRTIRVYKETCVKMAK